MWKRLAKSGSCTNRYHEGSDLPREREFLRPGRIDLGERADDLSCWMCDRQIVADHPHLADAIYGYWDHPSIGFDRLVKDYPEDSALQKYWKKTQWGVVKGEGQEPRKEDDPRPDLKVVK